VEAVAPFLVELIRLCELGTNIGGGRGGHDIAYLYCVATSCCAVNMAGGVQKMTRVDKCMASIFGDLLETAKQDVADLEKRELMRSKHSMVAMPTLSKFQSTRDNTT
jgi:hypothetical protein